MTHGQGDVPTACFRKTPLEEQPPRRTNKSRAGWAQLDEAPQLRHGFAHMSRFTNLVLPLAPSASGAAFVAAARIITPASGLIIGSGAAAN
jgi:hypothetical protein